MKTNKIHQNSAWNKKRRKKLTKFVSEIQNRLVIKGKIRVRKIATTKLAVTI